MLKSKKEVSSIRLTEDGMNYLTENKIDMSYFVSTVSRLSCHMNMKEYTCEELLQVYNYFKHYGIDAEKFSMLCNCLHGPYEMKYGLQSLTDVNNFLYQFERILRHVYTYRSIEAVNIGRYVQCSLGRTLTDKLKYIADKEDKREDVA